jgi:FAD/FMN-containing dehydrogenase
VRALCLVLGLSLTGLYVVIDAFTHLDDFLSVAEKSGNLFGLMGGYYAYRSVMFFELTSGTLAMVAAMFTDPAELPAYTAWVSAFAADLSDGSPGAYANFLGAEGEERVREAYPGTTWDRLREIKKRYDPGNLFRLNQNIPPAG